MTREGVPEAVDENADQLVDGVEAFKFRQFPAPQVLHDREG